MKDAPRVSAAASSLRALRGEAGLSQEELADRCGLSERTIRTLESGRATRPHRDTLHAIASALDLAANDRANFVGSWRGGLRALHELIAGPAPEAAIRTEFERQRTLQREISVSERVRIDADRRWIASTVRRTFEVVEPGLDHLLWVRSFMPELIDGARLDMRDCVNVEVSESVDIPEWNAKAWRGSLRGDLVPGEIYSLEYTTDWAAAHRADAPSDVLETAALSGLTKAMSSVFVEVAFDPDHVPARAFMVAHATLDGEEQLVRPLPISRFGVVQALVEPAPSGAHGIRWEWDDSAS